MKDTQRRSSSTHAVPEQPQSDAPLSTQIPVVGHGVWTGWLVRILTGLLAASFFLFLALPLAALLLHEPPANLWSAFLQPDVLQALQLSIVTTCVSTVVA